MNNKYINHVKHYINSHTPVEFILYNDKYSEIKSRFEKEDLKPSSVLFAAYTLFYTSLAYHKNAVDDELNRAYDILIGDYISSYIAEILYMNNEYTMLKLFATHVKEIMLHILNNETYDQLLDHIIIALKK